jgi:tripartite-type tricarboxylate transporter receptor subunit TctC
MRKILAAAALLIGFGTGPVQAQDYPSKRITLVVAFAPGGFADTFARVIGQKLGERWPQPVIVENRAGAGGNTAAKAVSTAAADGHTILVTTTALAINQSLYKKLDYSANDLTAVAMPASSPESIAVHPDKMKGGLAEFLAWAKGREITFATAGVGSGSHLAAEYFFKVLAKTSAAHVPFRGGALAVQAALGNQIDVVASSFGVMPHVAEGKLNGLAVASASRVAAMPRVPTFAEAGFPGFEAASWVGFFVPARTAPGLVATLNRAINEIVAEPATQKQLLEVGYQLALRDAPESGRYLKAEIEKWGTMVKAIGASVD